MHFIPEIFSGKGIANRVGCTHTDIRIQCNQHKHISVHPRNFTGDMAVDHIKDCCHKIKGKCPIYGRRQSGPLGRKGLGRTLHKTTHKPMYSSQTTQMQLGSDTWHYAHVPHIQAHQTRHLCYHMGDTKFKHQHPAVTTMSLQV